MTLDVQAALRGHAFVAGLPAGQLDRLAELASAVVFEEGDLVLVDGQRSTEFYLLLSGSVAVELRTAGYAVCVQALEAGQVFGWSALLNDQDTLFQVRARERTTALRIEGGALQAACRTDPQLGVAILERVLRVVARRVRATEQRFAEMCGVRV
jgi:CRP/FNR family transcriptional regulator, cyclic AMP receptor protein